MVGRSIDELKVGDFEIFQKTISESDVYLYAGITGDFNPAHLDDQAAIRFSKEELPMVC